MVTRQLRYRLRHASMMAIALAGGPLVTRAKPASGAHTLTVCNQVSGTVDPSDARVPTRCQYTFAAIGDIGEEASTPSRSVMRCRDVIGSLSVHRITRCRELRSALPVDTA